MKNLSELDFNELASKRNKLKSCLIGFVAAGILLLLLLLYLKARLATFIPILVLPITWLPLWIALQEVDKEIKSRSQI